MLNHEGVEWSILIAGCIVWGISVIQLDIASMSLKEFLEKINKKDNDKEDK